MAPFPCLHQQSVDYDCDETSALSRGISTKVESINMSSSKVFPRPEISPVHNKTLNVSLSREKSSYPAVSYSWSRPREEGIEDSEICYSCTGSDRSNQQGKRRLSSLSSRKHSFSSRPQKENEGWIFGKVLDPQSKGMRRCNRLFLLSCVLGIALDPLFLSVISINPKLSCLYVQKGNLIALTTLRAFIDFAYLTQVWMQLKTAYVSKESLVLGRGELVWDPRKIARNYLFPLSGFAFDVYIILPVPQIMLWVVTPRLIESGRDPMKCITFILVTFLVQYLPKVVHTALMVRRLQHVTGYIFGTASSGFFLNLLAYFISAHVAGSFWYLLTVQRVETCLDLQSVRIADSPSTTFACPIPISFGHQPDDLMRMTWSQNTSVQGCLKGDADNFQYGIYLWAVPLVTDGRFVQKILYPLFWGVMTFSSFGNALTPSNHFIEVLFAIVVITCGLLLFTLLIGNIQVFLHSITSKKSEMQLRIRDLEWWMRRRQLPHRLRVRVRQQERCRWAATRGVDEEALVSNLPEGLRRDIKRHLCLDLLKKVPLFQQLDDLILNNICDRLKPVLFIKEEPIIYEGNPVRQMLFFVRGRVLSMYRIHDNKMSNCSLGPGDFFGDELISWCLSKSTGRLPLANASLITLEMTEAFSLSATDLKYITDHFRYKVVSEQLKRTTRYYSTTWRMWAAMAIQLAWRRFKARRSKFYSGPLNFAPLHDGNLGLDAVQQDRLRMFTAMMTCPKPADNWDSEIGSGAGN